MKRIIIYVKDAEQITGKSERSCRYIFQQIRKQNNKGPKDPITFREFFDFIKLDFNKFRDDLR